MQLEILALRHQLAVYQRTGARPRLRPTDHLLWAWLSRLWAGWQDALIFVRPETVIAWRRRRFRQYWTRLTRSGEPGRPSIPREVRKNTTRDIIATDFFVVPTVRNQILFVFLVLAHERRRVLHFNVTAYPTAEWAAQQIAEAFPWADPPRFLLRYRGGVYGMVFRTRVVGLGMKEVLIAAQSQWQNPFVERLIGSIRRECLDHMIVLGERHLRRILTDCLAYCHRWPTHQSLEMDSPEGRQTEPADRGRVAEIVEVGGLHHHCERVAV